MTAPGAVLRTEYFPLMANRLIAYIKESKDELLKVAWPSRQQVVKDTLVVLGISAGIALFFGAIDFGMVAAFTRYLEM